MVIGKRGRYISVSKAVEHIGGYVLALDMTARNLQVSGCELPPNDAWPKRC